MDRKVRLGDPVWAGDKRVGRVTRVLAEPEDQQPAYFVVRIGKLVRREIAVPAIRIKMVDDDGLKLGMTEEQLLEHPDYEIRVSSGNYQKPIPAGGRHPAGTYTPETNKTYTVLRQKSVPERLSELRGGMKVVDSEGLAVGQVRGLHADENRRVTHLILRHPEPLLNRDRLLPLRFVKEVRGDEVHLSVKAEFVYAFGLFRVHPEEQDQEDF